ncbi:MAG: hypothetical protein HQK79_20755 [Desulfobacterales bacterium]|nr:hypothetical protein [Desulfobacterales bacterium]
MIQPIFLEKCKSYFTLIFSAVVPEIVCLVNKYGTVEIRVYYKSEFWDIVWDFDVYERCDPKCKYYCNGCLPEYKKFYSRRQELWINHCFEPLLKWTNETFIPSKWLYLGGEIEHGSRALIIDENEVKNSTKYNDFKHIFPIVKNITHCSRSNM